MFKYKTRKMLKVRISILQQFLNEAFCCYEAFALPQQYVLSFFLLGKMSSGFSFAKTSQNTILQKFFHPFVAVSQYHSDKLW